MSAVIKRNLLRFSAHIFLPVTLAVKSAHHVVVAILVLKVRKSLLCSSLCSSWEGKVCVLNLCNQSEAVCTCVCVCACARCDPLCGFVRVLLHEKCAVITSQLFQAPCVCL